MIFAMSRDLVSFLVVFLISILGFGIAFHSLFPDTPAFSGPSATFLTLFNAALGGHEFETYNGHKYQNLGNFFLSIIIIVIFLVILIFVGFIIFIIVFNVVAIFIFIVIRIIV